MSVELFSVGDWARFVPLEQIRDEDFETYIHMMNIGRPGPFRVVEVTPYLGIASKQRHSQSVVIEVSETASGSRNWRGRFQGSDLRHAQLKTEDIPGLIPVASA